MVKWRYGEKTGEIREDGAVWYESVGEWIDRNAAEDFLENLRNTDNGLSPDEEVRISKIFQSAVDFFDLECESLGIYRKEHSVILRAAGWNVEKATLLMREYNRILYPYPASWDKKLKTSQEEQNHLTLG